MELVNARNRYAIQYINLYTSRFKYIVYPTDTLQKCTILLMLMFVQSLQIVSLSDAWIKCKGKKKKQLQRPSQRRGRQEEDMQGDLVDVPKEFLNSHVT